MSSIDPLGNRCDRVLRVHVRRVHSGELDIALSTRFAQKIYGSIGIHFQISSMETLSLSDADRERFATQETVCLSQVGNNERDELYRRFAVKDFASITAFLIKGFVDPLRPTSRYVAVGCAAHEPHQPAVYVGSQADPWALAHEVGHVLLEGELDHSDAPNNVMRSGIDDIRTLLAPAFDPEQVANIRRSRHLLRC